MPVLFAIHALGTRVELALQGPDSPGLRAVGEAAIDEVRLWHDRLSLFQPHSFLSHINREAAARPVPLDEDLWTLLSICDRVHRSSLGAFDPTASMGRPSAGWAALVKLDERARTVAFQASGVRIDLGGVAKGFALDRAADVILSHGAPAAVLHGGTSSIVAIGDAPRDFGVRAAGRLFRFALDEGCLSVSAPRGRTDDGRTHILWPRDGEGAADVDTAMVVGALGEGAACDAWSTALTALGHRPLSMPASLGSAIHDGQRWRTHPLELQIAPEAA